MHGNSTVARLFRAALHGGARTPPQTWHPVFAIALLQFTAVLGLDPVLRNAGATDAETGPLRGYLSVAGGSSMPQDEPPCLLREAPSTYAHGSVWRAIEEPRGPTAAVWRWLLLHTRSVMMYVTQLGGMIHGPQISEVEAGVHILYKF